MIFGKATVIGKAADVSQHVAKGDLRRHRMLRQPAIKLVVQTETFGGGEAEQGSRHEGLGETVKQHPAAVLKR